MALAYPGHQTGFYGVPSVYDRLAAEQKAAPWAKRALLWYLVYVIGGLLIIWAEASTFRDIFHNLRVQMDTGVVQAQNANVGAIDLLNLLLVSVEAPFYILLLIWQFHAAKTAQLLYLPAAHSPGLGVGSWFIPIVNFWFPYQAIRDCLPPEDPGRRVVARLWMFYIMALVLNIMTAVLAFGGTSIAFILAAAAVALGAGFALNGIKAVQLIADAHQRLLSPNDPGPSGHPSPSESPSL